MNLTLQEVRDRIDWLLNNTTVMPTARTNVAGIDLFNGVRREAHFVAADREGRTLNDLVRENQELDASLERAKEKIEELRSELADVTD